MSKKFTIQIDYTTDVNDKKTRVRSCYQLMADNLPHAYKVAKEDLSCLASLKLGAIMPGHVIMGGA